MGDITRKKVAGLMLRAFTWGFTNEAISDYHEPTIIALRNSLQAFGGAARLLMSFSKLIPEQAARED